MKKNKMFKKMSEQVLKLDEAMTQYEREVIEVLEAEHKALEEELTTLKGSANVLDLEHKDQYFINQKSLKELPELINEAYLKVTTAHEERFSFKNALATGIYRELGDDFKEEYAVNLDVLLDEFNKNLTATIETFKAMEKLTEGYKEVCGDVYREKGVYLESNSHLHDTNKILADHNLHKTNFTVAY